MRKWLFLGCLALVAGCGAETTETGYHPRPLNSNDTIRKGYYAPPYSPQAREADAEKQRQQTEGGGVNSGPEGPPR